MSNDTQYSYNYYKIGAATVVLLAFTYGNPKLFTTSLFAAFGLKVFNQASDIKEVQNVRSLNVFDVCSKIITGAEYTILGIASSSIIGKIAKDMMPGNIPYKDSSAKIIGAIFSPLATFAYSTLLNSYYQVSPQNKSLVDTMVYYTSKTTIKEIFDALIVDKVSNIYPVAKIPIKIATQAFSSYFVKVTKNAISNQNVGELYNLYTLEQTIIVSTSRILGKQVMSGIMTEAPLAISSGIVALCAKTIYKDLKKK